MAIKTLTKTLGMLIQGRRIEIPPIQRDYAWDPAKSAQQLWDDLLSFHNNSDSEHYYLGNMISWVDLNGKSKELDDDSHIWQLLDGQQRLTSLTMIFNAIWAELNAIGSQLSAEICNEIYKTILFVDDDLFSVEECRSSLHPRREESRDFLKWLIENMRDGLPDEWEDPIARKMGNMQRVATIYHRYIRSLLDQKGEQGLVSFYQTLRDRVIVGVTLTDDLSMGFQMFQTANARGTPLTSYDMFRAFSIKRAKVSLNLGQTTVDKIVKQLNRVERVMNKFSDKPKEVESETKSIMTAWTSCRTGKHNTKAVIVKKIENDIDNIQSVTKLTDLIADLRLNSRTWEEFKTRRPGKRGDHDTEIWRMLGRFELLGFTMHWPVVLALRTAQDDLEWNDDILKSVISMIEWSVIKGVVCTGTKLAGKTNQFQQALPSDCNLIWNAYNGLEPALNKETFSKRLNYWLIEHSNKLNPSGFNLVSTASFTEENYVKAMLHLIDSGFQGHDPRGTGQKIQLVKLFSPKEENLANLSEDQSNLIGNYFLIRGSQAGGKSREWIKTFNRLTDLRQRLIHINKLSSNDLLNNIDINMNSNQIRGFITNRSKAIKQRLEEDWHKFYHSQINLP